MKYITIIYIFALFVLLIPNFLVKLPFKNKLLLALLHGCILVTILYFTQFLFNRSEGLFIGRYTENDKHYDVNLDTNIDLNDLMAFDADQEPAEVEHRVIVNEIVDYSALSDYDSTQFIGPHAEFNSTGVDLTIKEFIEYKSPISRFSVYNHTSGNYVTDQIISGVVWNGDPVGDLYNGGQKINIAFKDGKKCLNFNTIHCIRIPESYSSITIGKNYTAYYIWYPRESNNGWRTLHRGSIDHLGIVKDGNKDLGMYSNRNGGFKDSGYNIEIKWQVLIICGEGSNSTSSAGTTTFYVNDDDKLKKVGQINRVASGTGLMQFGWQYQAPGYFKEVGLLNQKLDDDDLRILMKLCVKEMNRFDVNNNEDEFMELYNILLSRKPTDSEKEKVNDINNGIITIKDVEDEIKDGNEYKFYIEVCPNWLPCGNPVSEDEKSIILLYRTLLYINPSEDQFTKRRQDVDNGKTIEEIRSEIKNTDEYKYNVDTRVRNELGISNWRSLHEY